MKPQLLLHTCCAPCSAYVAELLQPDFEVTLFYYNPNIYPTEEYAKRRDELKVYAKRRNLPFIEVPYEPAVWEKAVQGLEQEPEGGARCRKCYELRLRETAKYAAGNHFTHFASTLTISPHKNATWINELGQELAQKLGITFLVADFKKDEGFKKACELSRQEGFYRQNYCGCQYSIRKNPK